MHDRFMNGEDKDWVDYAAIDQDEGMDDRQEIERDEEEKWFQEGEVGGEEMLEKPSEDTGVLDY